MITHNDDPLLDRNGLLKIYPTLPISRTNLHRLLAKGFPPPIIISARRRAWRLSAVAAWIKKMEQESAQAAGKKAYGRK